MKRDKKLRAGVIGAGAIAQACHLPGYARNKHVELAAFADPAMARHREVAGAFPGLRGYRSYQDMLKAEDLDVVSVCTPNSYHANATIAALEAGCHVLCEKPIATTLKEADRMIAGARAARRKLMVGFTHRLYSGPGTCHEMLAKKSVGKPFMIRVRFAHGGPYPGWAKDKWFYDPKLAAGGAMLDMGIHAIDLCLWLMGPIAAVSAKAATLVKKIAVDDNAVLLLEFASGALGYIEVGWTSKPGFVGFEIYGTEGSLICDYLHSLRLCQGKASAGTDSSDVWTILDANPATGGWSVEIDRWIDVVLGKEKLTMTGLAGRNALEVALAAYRSSKTGKRIALT
ncbi:MAG: Gfo/Idh/MocA family oxidoreductase [Candidatus Hydrogenedentes bacterium]|nr:Gfo/Idh/MocA family oxidoreductase [Candidatus Hydrogenedentota bacterium]